MRVPVLQAFEWALDHYGGMEFLSMAISTFLGAAVALGADRLNQRREATLAEEKAINNLILDLASKRAFRVGPDWELTEGEMGRIVDSVQHARALVRDARLALQPRSRFLHPIRNMGRECNEFLEKSERQGDESLKTALEELSLQLADEVAALEAVRPKRILGDRPGSFALHTQAEASSGVS